MTEPTTWEAELDTLSGDAARFAAEEYQTRLLLARDDWEKLGRPVSLEIKVTP